MKTRSLISLVKSFTNSLAKQLLSAKFSMFLVVGGMNTCFGYISGVALLTLLGGLMPTFLIGVLSAIIAMTFNYLTYKFFVFRTTGGWLREIIRTFKVYGVALTAGIIALTVAYDIFALPSYISQLVSVAVAISITMSGNFFFTFRR